MSTGPAADGYKAGLPDELRHVMHGAPHHRRRGRDGLRRGRYLLQLQYLRSC